ncbi:MAG: hypothetical protein KRP56_06320 [Candidatus Methanogranum gryphiswaldense]|nr:MAG: hypothetical protein KRP56_06320 [Candidatus Methanogranum sp. U3.2.1]
MDKKIIVVIIAVILVVSGAGIYLVLKNDDNNSINLDVDLEVYGNADKDWDIDEDDAVLVEEYVAAVKNNNQTKIIELESEINLSFADANNDGFVDSIDVEQIKAISNGTEEKIWFLDGVGNVRSVETDISRIGCEYYQCTELCLILGLADSIVAVDNAPYMYKDFYFTTEQQSNITNMVNMNTPDYDFVNTLDLDVLLIFSSTASYEAKQDKIIDCDVLYLGLYNPDLTNTANSSFVQGVLKAGYIFGAVDRAEGYVDWILDYRDRLLEISNSIPEDEKPVVGISNYSGNSGYFQVETDTTMVLYKDNDPLGQAIALAGGKNIVSLIDTTEFLSSSTYSVKVQIDAVLNDDPDVYVDYFFLHMVKHTYSALSYSTTPEHGYLADDYTEIEAATEDASSRSLLTDEVISLIAGDFRNGCTGGVLLAAYMGNIINSEYYSSIDPIAMHNEYVQWMGIEDYDVATSGVFIYTAE